MSNCEGKRVKTEAQIDIVSSLAEVDAVAWDALAGPQPFVRHAFLQTLEATGCVGGDTGWQPRHLLLKREGELVGALPLYLRDDSYGEFVFDFSWADAYARSGRRYYPKLLTAIPFTPVPGKRLLAHTDDDRFFLIDAALAFAQQLGVSSWHCLFPTESDARLLAARGLMPRQGVQFHWHNADYVDFDAFLATMSHDKRKKIKQERRRVRDAGVSFMHRVGADITEADWHFFFSCYQRTYHMHRSPPYMNLDFFLDLARRLGDQMLLVMGYLEGAPVSVALNLFDGERLYGRYWGATQFISGLHFETCYYQALEFAIARRFQVFEGGAQGEHKLARGLLPTPTSSFHWLADEDFARAVGQFLIRETHGVSQYVDELKESSPYRSA